MAERRRRARQGGCLAVLGLVVAITGHRPAGATGEACRISGWAVDRAGLAVREAPSATARRIGRLPPFVTDAEDEYGPSLDILEARGGWLRIAEVRDDHRPSDRPARPVFAGTGWVDGRGVRVASQSATGRAAPRPDGPALVTLAGDEWLAGAGTVRAVTDCRGGWARVRYRLLPGTRAAGPRSGEAWFTRICASQRTTCETTPP